MRYLLLILLLLPAGSASAIQYMLVCDDAVLLPQDSLAYPFSTGDTVEGSVRVNGPIAISGSPQFYGVVTTSASQFICGPGYAPGFHGLAPVFSAPPLSVPTEFPVLRIAAATQGNFYSQPGKSYRVRLEGALARIFVWDTGTPFDSTVSQPIPIVGPACMFFDRPLQLYGHLNGHLTIGSSRTILILDNVWYDCTTLRQSGGYNPVPDQCDDVLGIISEGDIKIANTFANGRENSHGEGLDQTNRDSTDVVVMGSLWAAGKITFEQQNDPDSGYVAGSTPDIRGQFYLHGSMVMPHFTPWRRSNNDITGYFLKLKYDRRFRWFSPPASPPLGDQSAGAEDTLDFGGVPVGYAVWDTAHIDLPNPENLGAVTATPPFFATRVPPFSGDSFAIPVRLIAPHTGTFSGILHVTTTLRSFEIVLRGTGLPGGAPPLRVEIAPNPFNLITTLRYSIPTAGAVKITLFDVLGRTARQIDVEHTDAGEHTLHLNASDLASGVYFVKVQAGAQAVTRKLLLLK